MRFSGFDDAWVMVTVNSLAKVIDCKHRTPPYVDYGVPVISPGTIKWGEIDLENPTKRVTEEEYESLMDHCSPDYGDFVFSRNQSIGVACFILKKEKFVLGQDTILVQANKVDPFFLYFRIQTHAVQSLITRLSGGSTFSRINLKEIRNLYLKVAPSKKEQKKIASFLSAVDKKIQQLTRKKELLEQYKKGVMQKIFSQEIRFTDDNGKDYPDWDKKELGDVLDYIQPTKFLVKTTDYDDTYKTPVLTAGKTFVLGYTAEAFGIFKEDLPVIIFDDFTTAFKFVDFHFKAKSSAMKILKAKYKAVNMSFVYESMKVIRFPLGEHKRYWISEYQYMKINYPCEEEQRKIASFLSSIDQKIASVQSQLTQTQTFKKGLLQQLFV